MECMNILIVEDSDNLIKIYNKLIKKILKIKYRIKKFNITSVVSYEEFVYYKTIVNNVFDFAIYDWNIIGGTSEHIILDTIIDVKFSCIITGYPENIRLNELSNQYNIPILSKPITQLEFLELLERGFNKIYKDKCNCVGTYKI